MANHLHSAKKNKNDEFYTRKEDIEKELKHYKKHLKGKVIYCNCDDPEWSEFFLYFKRNFDHLGLKKVISTHYEKDKKSYFLEIGSGGYVKRGVLKSNGDFRSPECIEFLKEADIVITNPPFSLFREYIAQLMEYKKKFLIVGNINATTYETLKDYFKENKVWFGYSGRLSGFKVEKLNENKIIKILGVVWWTNMEHSKRNEKLHLWNKYDPEKMVKYDNYEAINVNKTVEIPDDYFDPIGVPITFLEKHNPEQFEILEIWGGNRMKINNKTLFSRIIIKRRR